MPLDPQGIWPDWNVFQISRLPLWSVFEFLRVKKKIINIYDKNPVFVLVRRDNVFCHHYFFKWITDFSEWSCFLFVFLGVGHGICRLDIISVWTGVADKIDFKLLSDGLIVRIFLRGCYNAHIHVETAHVQIVIEYIFHHMCLFILPEIDAGIAQT